LPVRYGRLGGRPTRPMPVGEVTSLREGLRPSLRTVAPFSCRACPERREGRRVQGGEASAKLGVRRSNSRVGRSDRSQTFKAMTCEKGDTKGGQATQSAKAKQVNGTAKGLPAHITMLADGVPASQQHLVYRILPSAPYPKPSLCGNVVSWLVTTHAPTSHSCRQPRTPQCASGHCHSARALLVTPSVLFAAASVLLVIPSAPCHSERSEESPHMPSCVTVRVRRFLDREELAFYNRGVSKTGHSWGCMKTHRALRGQLSRRASAPKTNAAQAGQQIQNKPLKREVR
jgi:hypothetical protein